MTFAMPQDAPPVEPPAADLLQQLQMLGWVDRTALAVLAVFIVIGLWKGVVWQVSRIGILLAGYVVAGRFGGPLGDLLARTPALGGEAGPAPVETPETTLYLAYVGVFVAVLVVLSLLAMLVQRLVEKAGLGFFDRLGGGVLGVATGGCLVLFGVFVVHMFFRGSQLAEASETSHSVRLSRTAIDWLGTTVPDELRTVFALAPLQAPGPDAQGSPTPADRASPGAPEAPTAPPQPAPLPGEPVRR